jgi:hypothetical protein
VAPTNSPEGTCFSVLISMTYVWASTSYDNSHQFQYNFPRSGLFWEFYHFLLLDRASPLLLQVKVKGKLSLRPGQVLGFQEVEAPRFQDNRHKMVVRMLALHTGCLYPSGNIPGTNNYVGGWVNPRAIVRPEGSGQRKTPMTIRNRTQDFQLVAQCLNQHSCR